ncbi:MAG: beta-lactamase family protein [Alphaproteobacteria bacterium]|nr:beta-lactamase family protein [Alphaproteobacteria bacterium]
MSYLIRSLVVLLLIAAGPFAAAMSNDNASSSQEREALENLEFFIDTMVATQRSVLDISAVTVSIVKDGKVVLAKAYGMENREKAKPATADGSLFFIGSTSKLFTWTAVMQQLERGNLDLDTDVNDYLVSFKIPEAFGKPITLRHILTHTTGFEESGLGYLLNYDPAKALPIEEAMARYMPARINPPGAYSSYSNYATALAGLIVQNVSGQPFNDYIKQNIFTPLGMDDSTFEAPLPESMLDRATKGYKRVAGVLQQQPYELVTGFGPAGAMVSTATDMSKFMQAHLQNGQLGSARVLKAETARLMHSVIYRSDERLPGMAHGFYEAVVNGHRLIGHGGDISQFHTNLMLDKEEQLGIFVSYVAATDVKGRDEFVRAFYDHYYPEALEPIASPSDFNERAAEYAGKYRLWRHNESTIEKALGLVAGAVNIAPSGNNTLVFSGLGEPRQYVEIGEDYFREVDGKRRIVFGRTEDGSVRDMYFDAAAFVTASRVGVFEGGLFSGLLPVLSFLIFMSVLTGWIYRRQEFSEMPLPEKRAVRLSVGVATANILFVVLMGMVIGVYQMSLFGDIPLAFDLVLFLPVMAVVLAVGVLYCTVQAWRHGYWRRGRRIHYSLVAFAAVYMTVFYFYWNILGWQHV